MLRDLRDEKDVSGEHQYDLCIVGAGAAGIALAREFIGTRVRVCLLEAGALDFDRKTQDLYKGDVIGVPYADLDSCRLRFFGGTTNHWAGYCSPFPDYSFERHAWIDHSGWPLQGAELRPYYQRTHALLGMEPAGWDPVEGWDVDVLASKLGAPRLALEPGAFKDKAYVIKPVRMGALFRDALKLSPNVDVFFHANVVEIQTSPSGLAVTGLDVRTLSGQRGSFRARHYVLAAGGIENARLMLNSSSMQPAGVGNQHDLVGRYFNDHAQINAGFVQPSRPDVNLALYDRRSLHGSETLIWKELTFETQRAFKLVPAAIRMKPSHSATTSAGGKSLLALAQAAKKGWLPDDLGTHVANVVSDVDRFTDFAGAYLWHGSKPIDRIDIQLHLEPAPNRDSRVLLGHERDALGLRRVKLDWRLSEIDARTVRWITNRFASAAAGSGLGRMKVEFDDSNIDRAVIMDFHHISTTRMADSPSEGVVDRDCRVHGMDNLFVAGSSVFSTCGWGSPTMLIVALALRLADHLKPKVLT